jgi:hypothetical protein
MALGGAKAALNEAITMLENAWAEFSKAERPNIVRDLIADGREIVKRRARQ